MRFHGSSDRPRARLIDAVRADLVLSVRLVSRHPVPRAALGWAVGLAALTRILAGPAPGEPAAAAVVSLAGLLAAAAGPRIVTRGGALETLRWVRGSVLPPLVARLGGVVLFGASGAAAAGFAAAGTLSLQPVTLGGAVVHAGIVGGLAAALTPAFGCSTATVLTVLLVAAGVGAGHDSLPLPVAGLSALPPPGMLAAGLGAGVGWSAGLRLGVWGALVAAGLLALARRASRPGRRGIPESPCLRARD